MFFFILLTALSAALTCASVAVADAGIEMYDVIVGCALVRLRSIKTRHVPDLKELLIAQKVAKHLNKIVLTR